MREKGVRNTAVQGLLLRALSYVAIGTAVFYFVGLPYLAVNLIFYPIGAGFAYASYYAASNLMVFNTLGHSNQGSLLGVYSALVGMATMAGSFLSGLISFYIGYGAAFIAASLWLGLAAILTSVLGEEVESNP
jgi:MFS family permease